MPWFSPGLLCFLPLACLVLGGATAQAAPLRICAADWPPFTTETAGRRVGGLLATRVTRAMADLGYEATIHVVAWERCLKDLAEGFYAAAYPAAHGRDREVFGVYPPLPLDTLRYVAVVRKGEGGAWRGGSDLTPLPKPIGVPKGWAVLDELAGLPGAVLEASSQTMEQDVRKVLAGRLGTAVVEARTAAELLARLDSGGRLAVLEPPLVSERKVYLLLGRKAFGNWSAQQLADKLAARLQADTLRP